MRDHGRYLLVRLWLIGVGLAIFVLELACLVRLLQLFGHVEALDWFAVFVLELACLVRL